MSVIHIINHDESVYDHIKPAAPQFQKSPRYKSAVKSAIKKDECPKKKSHATMGPARVPPPDPTNFLRKHTNNCVRNELCISPKHCSKTQKRPPVPSLKEIKKSDRRDEKPAKNFIQKNVNNIIKKKPPEIPPKFVDTRKGDIQQVKQSGLDPYYIYKKDFGKSPDYLVKRVDKAISTVEAVKDKKTQEKSISNCQYITREERNSLLNGLKEKWDEKQKEYQLLPIITDTIPKILRKTKLEKELNQLEKDITLIESHPFLYVYDDK